MAEEKKVRVKTIHAIQHEPGNVMAPGSVVNAPKSVADLWISMGAAALYVEEKAEKPAEQPKETAEEKAAREAAEEAAELAGKSK